MRISDWSSDVCSSDLGKLEETPHPADEIRHLFGAERIVEAQHRPGMGDLGQGRGRRRAQSLRRRIRPHQLRKIGRASCRERVCQYVSISVVAVSLKKKKIKRLNRRNTQTQKPH